MLIKIYVENAVNLINFGKRGIDKSEIIETQNRLLRELAKIRFGKNNEGYIFIVSYDGTTILNDTQKALVGENLWNITDPSGIKIIQEERKAAEKKDGDFIFYSWEKPTTGEIAPKVSFIKGIPDWKWMVGAGLYIDDFNKDILNLKHKLLKGIITKSLILFIISTGMMSVILLLFHRTIKLVNKDISIVISYYNGNSANETPRNNAVINFTEFKEIADALNNMIASKRSSETRMLLSEEKYRNLFSSIQDVIIITDKNRTIIDANQPALKKQFGYDLEEVRGKNALMLFENYTEYEKSGKIFFSKDGNIYRNKLFTLNYKKKDGRTFPAEALAFRFKTNDTGELLNASINRNIEKRIKIQNSLSDSLKEKTILLREIHHRVKNSMAIIIAFLSLQSSNSENKELKTIFYETERRIRAMALVHELLYNNTKIKSISMDSYLNILLSELLSTSNREINLIINLSDERFDIDTLIPIGLIVNEIITNTIKYAFNSSIASPEIFLSLSKQSHSEYILVISDNGIGIPEPTQYVNKRSIGLLIIKTLVDQINGTMELESENGTKYIIKFPI